MAGNTYRNLHLPNFNITNQWILAARGSKSEVNPREPYASLVENERMPNGNIEKVATIFLTNKECPFRCLMCDLWKNTTDLTVPIRSIPHQIEFALEKLPSVKHIKLYNSGNFFDTKAIPAQDYQAIANLLSGFNSVLVENHPKLTNRKVLEFRDLLKTNLQVAMGLETVHPHVLPLLNKQMTLDDFSSAVHFLAQNDILARTFILLRPPFLTEAEGVEWAKKSIEFAFECGVECCVIIPTRSGNGAMDMLEKQGLFESPKIKSLEEVLDYGISLKKGRVFADLWDLSHFCACNKCYEERKDRLQTINTQQVSVPEIKCYCPESY